MWQKPFQQYPWYYLTLTNKAGVTWLMTVIPPFTKMFRSSLIVVWIYLENEKWRITWIHLDNKPFQYLVLDVLTGTKLLIFLRSPLLSPNFDRNFKSSAIIPIPTVSVPDLHKVVVLDYLENWHSSAAITISEDILSINTWFPCW